MQSILEAREYHLAECRYRNLSPKTLRAYGDSWLHFQNWCVETGQALSLRSLNTANVQAAANVITERSLGKRGGTSAKRAFVVNMKVFVRFLVDEDILEADVLARLKRPKVASPARKPLETWEIQSVRGSMSQFTNTSDRDLAMYALSLDTGVRVAMDKGDFDLESNRVRVWGKGNKERVLPFGNGERGGGKTAKLIRQYLRWRRPTVETEKMWLSLDGKPFTTGGWRIVFQRACKMAGIAERTPHELRHTFATRYLVRNPGDVQGLRYTMGHQSEQEYQTYVAEAGRIIADTLGRESVFEDATTDPTPIRRRPADIRDRGRAVERKRETAHPQLRQRG